MKNRLKTLLVLALLIVPIGTFAYLKEDGFFENLAVTGDTYLAGHLRVDNNAHFYGEIYTNDHKGFTGNCPPDAKHIYENGLLVDCKLPTKDNIGIQN